jgi:hypothetical protein
LVFTLFKQFIDNERSIDCLRNTAPPVTTTHRCDTSWDSQAKSEYPTRLKRLKST